MLRGPDQLHCQRLLGAFHHANTAAQTMLINYTCLGFIGTGDIHHLDSIELTALDAGLTAAAKLLVDNGPVSAGGKDFMDVAVLEQGVDYHTAVITAVADKVAMGGIQGNVYHAPVFAIVDYRQGFFKVIIFRRFYILDRFTFIFAVLGGGPAPACRFLSAYRNRSYATVPGSRTS